MPLGQFAGILGHHSQVAAVDFKVTYCKRMYNSTIIVEVGREMLGTYQFPIRPVVWRVNLYGFGCKNPSIGILLCKDADMEIVRYALNRSMSPTMVAQYKEQLQVGGVIQQSLVEFCKFLNEDGKNK